ncbi:MAG: hypothetical protein JWN46_1752 [Acidimicrobiales bacterium]|nr:hypothetical protein [Acidimicrobiales bacterium]
MALADRAGRQGRALVQRLRTKRGLFVVAQYARTLGAFGKAMAHRTTSVCSCCEASARFLPVGNPPRLAARCPACASLERHRLVALAVMRGAFVVKGARVLHFAPEDPVRRVVEPDAGEYRTADLALPKVDHQVDIQDTGLPPGQFDVVLCSHVLEHVADDRKAMREMRRILAPDGVLVAMVPLMAGWAETYENADVVSSAERATHFGQADHVRWYGRDFADRLREAGFSVTQFVAGPSDALAYSLVRGDTLFLARPDGSGHR